MQGAVTGTLGAIRPVGLLVPAVPLQAPAAPAAAGDDAPAPDGHRHRGHRLRPAAVLGPARLGRVAGRAAHPVRRARDRAGVLHPARHRVLPGHPDHGRAAADPAHAAPVAVRRGRPADGLRQHPARQRHPAGRDRGRLHADPAGGLAGPGRGRRGVRAPGGRLRAGLPRPVRGLQPDHQRRPVPVVAHHQLRQLRRHQAAARPAAAVPEPGEVRPRPARRPAGPSPGCSASPPRPTTCGPATPGGGSTPTPASTRPTTSSASGSPSTPSPPSRWTTCGWSAAMCC